MVEDLVDLVGIFELGLVKLGIFEEKEGVGMERTVVGRLRPTIGLGSGILEDVEDVFGMMDVSFLDVFVFKMGIICGAVVLGSDLFVELHRVTVGSGGRLEVAKLTLPLQSKGPLRVKMAP